MYGVCCMMMLLMMMMMILGSPFHLPQPGA
jgi:hypothetical protein